MKQGVSPAVAVVVIIVVVAIAAIAIWKFSGRTRESVEPNIPGSTPDATAGFEKNPPPMPPSRDPNRPNPPLMQQTPEGGGAANQ